MVTLYFEELKAMTRGRFAWLGAAVLLLAIGGLATVGTQDAWLDGYGVVAYFLVPLAFIPFAAAAMASPRANRFVESVFTAPVARRDWFMAKVLVLLTVAAAYYLALVPMMLVYTHHVGTPFLLRKFLQWAPGLLVASVAIGTLIGVLFVGGSIAPPAATGMGLLLAYAGLLPLQELMVARGNGAGRLGHIALISPPVLLKNALGFSVLAATIPDSTARTWISVLVVVAGAFGLASWVFLRAQGVETWEPTRSQRWAIPIAIATVSVFPIAFADTSYETPAPPHNNAPVLRGVFARGGVSIALTSPGAALPSRCCGAILNRETGPLGTDENATQDLLILLPVDASQPLTDLQIEVSGEGGLHAVADPAAIASSLSRLESRSYPSDSGPAALDGHHIARGWVARVPVTLNPTNPWDIGGDRYPLNVKTVYRVARDDRPRTLVARGAIDAQVSPAIYEMAGASMILPLMCLAAAVARWRSTR